jgi:hypothetical protein
MVSTAIPTYAADRYGRIYNRSNLTGNVTPTTDSSRTYASNYEVVSSELIATDVGPVENVEAILSVALGETRSLEQTKTKTSTTTITTETGVSIEKSFYASKLLSLKCAINSKIINVQSDTITFTLSDKEAYTFPTQFASQGYNSAIYYVETNYDLYKCVVKTKASSRRGTSVSAETEVVYAKIPVLHKFVVGETITLP